MTNLLIVFCKNPTLGKVKTRLAKSIGDEKALAVYKKLLEHTHKVANECTSDYAVYYSNYVNKNDLWVEASYKALQYGDDIGERMSNAISDGLTRGYSSVVLIGADIYELSLEVIDSAFSELKSNDVVLGPAKDGGYYLIGMKKPCSELFQLRKWSSSVVLRDTVERIKIQELNYSLVDQLNDIDFLEDLHATDLIELISTPQDLE
ncbi:MAG: TIGR04282 family arsenosugar biosynthesis glycosyltransferase [Bacteroidota bacterium]